MHSQQTAILLHVFELQKFALHETTLYMLKMREMPCLFLFKTEKAKISLQSFTFVKVIFLSETGLRKNNF